MSPDVVSLVSTDQNWWNQWIEVSVQGDREPVSLSGGGTVLFLESKTMAGCRWKKSNERDREKKMHGPLLILAFLSRGWGGGGGWRDKRKLPKAAPGRSVFGSKSDRDDEKKKASRFVSCSLNEIHHHKNSMTDLTRPGSLPCEELQAYPSSKRQEKAKFVLPRKSGKIS